jgi:MATE family multidrug resistance protein
MAFDAMQVVLVNVMRSMGDQVAAGINSIIGFFLVTGVGGWWLVQQGVGPMALIWASGAGMVTVMVLQSGRLIQLMGRLRRQNAWSPTLSPGPD